MSTNRTVASVCDSDITAGDGKYVKSTTANGFILGSPPALTHSYASGRYYGGPGIGVGGTSTFTNQRQFFTPFYVGQPTAFNQIMVNMTIAGNSTAVVRMGIYNDNGSGAPGTLVVDGGTVAADSTTGQKTVSISQTLLGLYWVSACVQSASVTQPTLTRYENSLNTMMGWMVGATTASLGGTLPVKDSVSGAFADPAGTTTATGGISIPSIWLRAT